MTQKSQINTNFICVNLCILRHLWLLSAVEVWLLSAVEVRSKLPQHRTKQFFTLLFFPITE